MADNTDMHVSGDIDDTATLDRAADRMFTEVPRHREFALHRRNPTT